VGGTGSSGTAKAASAKSGAGKDSGKSESATTADADTAKPALAATDAAKAQATPTKADTPNSDGAPVVTPDPSQQMSAQPDPNAPASAPANANAAALPTAAAEKIAAAAGKPAQAPRHDIDATSAVTAGTNAFGATGGDPTTASQASASAAASASGTTSTGAAAGTSAAPAATATPMPVAVPLSGIGVEIAGKALSNKNHFEIRLDPPELGRIEVKLSVDRQGQITSHVIADRSDTLDLLRRDASGLERSMQDAGLKMSGNGMQFSLRDQSSSGQQNMAGGRSAPQIIVQDSVTVDTPRGYTAYSSRVGGLDIRV
jgi:hypothetical protein